MSNNPKRDVLAWAALAAALTVTASAEYELARACGFGQFVAAGVPAALDVYAVRAIRAGRDVLAVVLTMITVNALAHLSAAHLLPVSVPLVVAVSALAPLVLWRVHRLGHEEATEAAPVVQVDTPEPQVDAAPVHQGTPEIPQVTAPAPELAPEPAPEVPTEVDTPASERLSAEEARRVIEEGWRAGRSVRETAVLATRAPSWVGKVYASLNAQQQIDGQTEIEVAA